MRHHKIKKTLRKRKGGAWYNPLTWLDKKPEEAVQAVPAATEKAMSDVVTPLGATNESTGVPGEMSASAPAAPYLGGRRRKSRKTKKSRKSRR